ncbi:NACHT domain-containing protein [Allorhizocola rhizosphaerae]|uniref:NACHT domain-containing protein n=1 Tax=Allorhizocola rhizosphaerae TaxID=1872709 RepID=UPI000E3D47E1|nr:NACHT domain-containing protein [Allorhizocola rhizosphaerae]
MDVVFKTGLAVITPAVRWWLADRQKRAELALPLSELIDVRVTDNFRRRSLRREVEAMRDAVAERVMPLFDASLDGLGEAERVAAFEAVADAFAHADLTDVALFEADMHPAAIARRVRERFGQRATLSEPGHRLYEALLAECCACYVQLVQQLAPFEPRALTELLSRVSGLGDQLRQGLSRLPMRTLDAPDGDESDAAFLRRYLQTVSETLDEIEMFGVDVHRFRPRTAVSMAYISLTVSTTAKAPFGGGYAPTATRVEAAIGAHQRLLVRGEAGSGKTTLLKWLAVTASRGGFTGDLASWNGLTPYYIRLRSHAGSPLPRADQFLEGVADHDVDLMPRGWVHRRLDAGAGLLLVDGVDELTKQERPRVREWLRRLLRRYPQTRVVVTSRPSAAGSSWLQDEGFGSATLERMNPADVRRFVAHWHDAVRQAGGLPCEESELPRYESALLTRLESNPHMAVLATTPLLCAMLCALNLDRRTHLPRDRMGIYRAALELLVERREVDRAVASHHTLIMETADKLHLLRHLAWRMTVNNRAEAVRSDAELWIGDKLKSIPRLEAAASTVLSHLIERSGIIREPVEGRVDFVHRSLQEYLAAIEAAEQSDLGLLVDRAHLDQWHDTIVMAAGAAHVQVRRRLIEDLERRARDEPKYTRTIRLLIARCAETMTAPEPAVLSTVERCCAALLPPRGMRESRSLASIGEPLLHHMPASLCELSEKEAAAMVHTAALINGPLALDLLAQWARDPRSAVQRELANCWQYFDPADYAGRVLADAPLVDGRIHESSR